MGPYNEDKVRFAFFIRSLQTFKNIFVTFLRFNDFLTSTF